MEIFISLGQWWANIISAAVSVINSACMWISLEDNASTEWPCCELLLVVLWWAQGICRGSGQRKSGPSHSVTSKNIGAHHPACWGAYLASSAKPPCHGWPWLEQTARNNIPVLNCSAAFKGQAMRGRVNSKGNRAGRKAVGKERGLIYERGGCISIQPERDPCKCSWCGTPYRHYIVGQRSTEKFHVSQKYSQRSLFPSDHVTEVPIVPVSRKLCAHQTAEDDWRRRGFQK